MVTFAEPPTDDPGPTQYSSPTSLEQLAATNWEYVKAKTSRQHTGTLLQELVAEVKLGRVVGPTRPPAGWE